MTFTVPDDDSTPVESAALIGAAPAEQRPDQPVLRVRGVVRRFGTVTALDGIDLSVNPGEFVTLLGPSGCGKTTLLRSIAGFENPDAGEIEIDGRDIVRDPPERRPVNLVFQSYALFPHLSVAENVGFGLTVANVRLVERRERVAEALDVARLAGYGDRRIDELSGGQQQRVALARAIVNRPRILLLDEPLGALDLQLRKAMQLELRAIHHQLGTTFIYVTHDQEEALVMSDRIVVMRDGRIEQQGPPTEVYLRPMTRFVAAFIGETNLIVGVSDGNRIDLTGLNHSIRAEGARGQVSVSVRPEHMTLGSMGVPGTVSDSIFLGPFIRHLVRLANNQTVTVEESPRKARLRGAGEKVFVTWNQSDAVVLES